MNLDAGTKRVVELYSKYPFPWEGTHDDFFPRFILPAMTELARDYPIRRLLDAGCGTGNVTVEIGSHLPGVEVTAVDLTDISLGRAKERAEERKLTNIRFQKSNLLEHDPALGVFDFVYCQGVIHHLSDPLAGLKNLNRYLKRDHHAFVWLYSLLGRKRILEFREALRILGVEDLPWEQKVQLAMDARPLFLTERPTLLRKFIKVLDFFERNRFKGLGRYVYNYFAKPSHGTKAGISVADQYLHPQDKYYRVAEAFDLFSGAGFEFVRVLTGMSNSLTESFKGQSGIAAASRFSKMETYVLIELHERPEGIGYLIKKTREIAD